MLKDSRYTQACTCHPGHVLFEGLYLWNIGLLDLLLAFLGLQDYSLGFQAPNGRVRFERDLVAIGREEIHVML